MAGRSDVFPLRKAAPAPDPAAANRPVPPTMDIGEFLAIVMRRRRLLAPCMALAGALWLGYIALTPTRYTASMAILIDPRERMPLSVEAPPMPQNPDAALVESQMRILTSKAVLRRIVEAQGIVNDPDYAPGTISQIISSVTGLLSSKSSDPDSRIDGLIEALGRDVTTRRGERTYIIDIDVKARTPEKAVKLAKALTDAYFANQTGMSDEVAARQAAWLDGRLNDLRGRVEAAERRAQDYRDAQSIVASDGRLSPEQQLKDANDALVAARGKRSEIEARYEQLKFAMAHGGKSESINDAIRSPVIEKLRGDQSALARDEAYERSVLGPRHPSYLTTKMQLGAVQTQIAAELQRIELASERELKSAKAAERDAAKLVATLEGSTSKAGDSRVELGQLESQATALRGSYEKMLTARENVKRDVVETPTVTVVDPPVASPSRTSPKISLAAFVALAGGLNLWILAALVAEYQSRRRLPASTASSPLAPRKSRPGGGAPMEPEWFAVDVPSFAAAKPFDSFADRRALQTNVARVERAMRGNDRYRESIDNILQEVSERCGVDEAAPVIAIASQTRGAGASTTAISLAYAACARGMRVLLVDRDFGQPDLSGETSDLRRTPLGRPGQVARVLRRDGESDGEILLLPFDKRGQSLPDARLKSRFDLIVLDCGLLAKASDSLGDADALLLVERGGAAARRLAPLLENLGIAVPCLAIIRSSAPERLRRSA